MNTVQTLEEKIRNISTPPFKVLLVDDQAIVAAAVKQLLADAEDLEVIVCDKGAEALRIASDIKPSIILQDLLMPDMDGMQLVRFYRACEATKDIPVVVLSSKEQAEIKARAFELGANDYLIKLPHKVELVARLRYHVKAYIEHLELHLALAEVQRLSNSDGLTDIANRRYFDKIFTQEYKRAIRSQEPISLALIDIDHFKLYNDHYGHQAGDEALIQVAKALSLGLHRASDFCARYGGEEFTIIMPNTNVDGAQKILEQLRQDIIKLSIVHDHSLTTDVISISIGLACIIPQVGDHPENLLKAADLALYQAKEDGRNRIQTHQSKRD